MLHATSSYWQIKLLILFCVDSFINKIKHFHALCTYRNSSWKFDFSTRAVWMIGFMFLFTNSLPTIIYTNLDAIIISQLDKIPLSWERIYLRFCPVIIFLLLFCGLQCFLFSLLVSKSLYKQKLKESKLIYSKSQPFSMLVASRFW